MNQVAIYNEETLGTVKGSYSQGIKYRDLFFTVQVPTLPDGHIVSNDAYDQTLQILKNIEAALREVGAELKDILTCRIYLTDMNEYAAMNKAYSEMINFSPLPSRVCVQVAGLYPGYKVEMEVMCSIAQ